MEYYVGSGHNSKYPGVFCGPWDHKPASKVSESDTLWAKRTGGDYPNCFIYWEEVEWDAQARTRHYERTPEHGSWPN